MHDFPTHFSPMQEQPVECIKEVCGIYFRAVRLVNVGDVIPQHTHDYAHATVIVGQVRLWKNKQWAGDFPNEGPGFDVIEIEAHAEHVFMALAPNTTLSCAHNLNGEPYKYLAETKLES